MALDYCPPNFVFAVIDVRVWLVDGVTLDPAVLHGLGVRFVSTAMEVEP